ncbi:hypothetical protein KDX27_31465 [Burkholderia cenocepacia]|nr:hypothetical protein [Burkholderia cenocepacia]MBR8172258.1 hypothetical protein [Burkholderia cenocepacia]
MNGGTPRRGWRAIEHWPTGLRVMYHLVLGGLLTLLAAAFEAAGSAWRAAAQQGHPLAHAGREWVRTQVGSRDAVSLLEHGATGAGCALFAFAALQVGYGVIVSARGRPVEPWRPWQWVFFAIGIAGVSCGMASQMYPNTRVLTGLLIAVSLTVPLAWPNHASRAALAAPARVTGAVGAVFWLVGDGLWKVYHAPHAQVTAETVALQLGLGLAGLVAASWAFGWAARRSVWLHPAPIGGR